MASKRETLLIKAIKDEMELFTSEDILIVAGIDNKEINELHNRVSDNTDEIIESFLKSKLRSN